MTMPYGSAEEPSLMLTETESVPVHVVSTNAKPGKSIAPEFGRWRTFLIANVLGNDLSVPGAKRIANRSLRRHRLLVGVFATVAAQTVTDGVIVGSREEIAALIPGGNQPSPSPLTTYTPGGYIPIGTSFRWEAQQELWAAYPVSNVASVIVTVCDEQYASDPDAWREDR